MIIPKVNGWAAPDGSLQKLIAGDWAVFEESLQELTAGDWAVFEESPQELTAEELEEYSRLLREAIETIAAKSKQEDE